MSLPPTAAVTARSPIDPITIDSRCTACGLCLATCPHQALRRAPQRPHLVADRCTSCLACIEICPVDAIRTNPIGLRP